MTNNKLSDEKTLKDLLSTNIFNTVDAVTIEHVRIVPKLNRFLVFLSTRELPRMHTNDYPMICFAFSKKGDFVSITDDFFDSESNKVELFNRYFSDNTLERIEQLEDFYNGIKRINIVFNDNKRNIFDIVSKYNQSTSNLKH